MVEENHGGAHQGDVDSLNDFVPPEMSPEARKSNDDLGVVWGIYRRLVGAGTQPDIEKTSSQEELEANVDAAWDTIVKNLPADGDVDLNATGEEFKRELTHTWSVLHVGSDY